MKDTLEQVQSFLEKASDEEIGVFQNFLSAMENKQSSGKTTYLNHLLDWEKNFIDNQTLEMTIPITPLIRNVHDMVHGGITATLVDTTLGTLAAHQYSKDIGVVTTEIKVNYIAPGVGSFLRCHSKLVHKGRHICITEGKVYDDKNNLVAIGTGSFFAIKLKERS